MPLSKHVCVDGFRFLGMLKKSVYNLKTVLCQVSVRVFLTIDVSCLADKVERCFRALPLQLDLCTCAACTPYTDGELEYA